MATGTLIRDIGDPNRNVQLGLVGAKAIELIPSTSASNGGYIDFHYAGDTSVDCTSRIIESSSGVIEINGISITDGLLNIIRYARDTTSTTQTIDLSSYMSAGGSYALLAFSRGWSTDTDAGCIYFIHGIQRLYQSCVKVCGGTSSGTPVMTLSGTTLTVTFTNTGNGVIGILPIFNM